MTAAIRMREGNGSDMWAVLVTIITGIFGAAITYSFQQRSWLFQQKSRIKDEQIAALGGAIERLARVVFNRIALTELMIASIDRGEEKYIQERLIAYREFLREFNSTYREAFALLIREDDDGFQRVRSFENDVIGPLVAIGAQLEKICVSNERLLNAEHTGEIERDVRLINSRAQNLTRDVYADMQRRRDKIFVVDLSEVHEGNLGSINTWNLFKLLFVRRNPPMY